MNPSVLELLLLGLGVITGVQIGGYFSNCWFAIVVWMMEYRNQVFEYGS